MTIEELRRKKKELEQTINKAIAEFEEATTVQICDISYDKNGLHCGQMISHSANIQIVI